MSENKTEYQRPEITVVRLENAEMLCTSGTQLTSYDGEEWGDD